MGNCLFSQREMIFCFSRTILLNSAVRCLWDSFDRSDWSAVFCRFQWNWKTKQREVWIIHKLALIYTHKKPLLHMLPHSSHHNKHQSHPHIYNHVYMSCFSPSLRMLSALLCSVSASVGVTVCTSRCTDATKSSGILQNSIQAASSLALQRSHLKK